MFMTPPFADTQTPTTPPRKGLGLILLLGLMVLASAFAVIWVKDLYRRLTIEQQQLTQTKQKLAIARGQLLLEYSTWAAQPRIQSLSQSQLKMQSPKKTYVIIDPLPDTPHNETATE